MINTTVVELSTDGVPAAKRFELWRDTALCRLDLEKTCENRLSFEGRLRRTTSGQIEFWDHRAGPLTVRRSRTRCRIDGRGDIGVSLVLDCENALVQNVRDLTLRSGDLYLIDYSEPVRAARPKHRELALMLRREDVSAVLGGDLSDLAGQQMRATGVSALLRSHMQRTADFIQHRTSKATAQALTNAVKIALVALQIFRAGRADPDQLDDGLYLAALMVIEQYCSHFALSPQAIARSLKCSRATLYRLFARRGETVAGTIWRARLDRACRMLTTPTPGQRFSIAEIASRCGFPNHAAFSHMFKREFGLTPREARNEAAYAPPRRAYKAR